VAVAVTHCALEAGGCELAAGRRCRMAHGCPFLPHRTPETGDRSSVAPNCWLRPVAVPWNLVIRITGSYLF
jgi:hypothetical protein